MNKPNSNYPSLNTIITQNLESYFITLEGELPTEVYKMVISQVEKPLIEFILKQTEYNKSKAADMLGINRNTLRKKIQQYNILIP